ncbi:MAG: glycoside hydrolase family 25 protein [Bacteroidetes bacterium]|nr:glycoside hydrolase family 25 protein [Bacteroidota bacterium]
MKKWIGIGVLSIMVVFAVYYLVDKGYIRFNYPSRLKYPVQGIDISHHQGKIDWKELESENMDFIFIKATEGGDFVDANFQENWYNAIMNGYKVGAYHFFSFCKSGKVQGYNFVNTVPYDSCALPPVIDLEFGANCIAKPKKQEFVVELREMVKILEDYYHKSPIFYVSLDFYDEFIVGENFDNKIWARNILHKPRLSDGKPWTFWQFDNKGRIGGIQTPVDMNVFEGNKEELNKFAKRRIQN